MGIVEPIFWICLFLVFYTYLGYGLVVVVLVRIKRVLKPTQPSEIPNDTSLPTCTLVIAAYNEVDFIEDKVVNSLQLKYPKDKLKITFVTDGSDDGTPDLLEKMEGVEVRHSPERKGKIAAINRAMKVVDSDIVVFCDANTQLNQAAILEIAKHYQNPKIGGVSGEKVVLSDEKDSASGAGEGIYWKYESFLKRMDAELCTLVGSAGELFSIRTSLFKPVEADTILDDFMISMRLVQDGYKVEYEPAARASETASQNVKEEFKRKVRIGAGGFQSIVRMAGMLNIFKHGLTSFVYTSHRVMRWAIAPFCLLALLPISIALATNGHMIYAVLLAGQLLFYALAMLGWILEQRKLSLKVLFVPMYFTMMNWAVLKGFARFIKGNQSVTWEKSKRRS